ncbi:urea ABC transporter permease subunit UrtB [Providencia burhodogranariea]|uniref:Urea ABC transporter permease UrtB n=1 Tax=Providencia burhodogranariea DSM 19968 TaxID=1141662 RepID=K8WZW7_9GAMM|nr:urea ABC transporter permease subunit UrtB [Providencia burhodogranariea]EKT62912.1 urea ABC transporter permease UrtB [Providencia burhodogranariea DSM 19968]
MTLRNLFLSLLLMLPLFANAGTAAEFTAASRPQQVILLQQWAAVPQDNRLPLLEALSNETVVIDQDHQPFNQQGDNFYSLDTAKKPNGETKKLFINNRLRVLIASALAAHQLVSNNPTIRLQAAQKLQRNSTIEQLPLIEQHLAGERDTKVHAILAITAANLQLASSDAQIRLKAVKLLGESNDPNSQVKLQQLTHIDNEPDAQVRTSAAKSLQQIEHRLLWGDLLGQAFSGISLGSILLLAALGLAITYGLLGVINMAHGEMLMLGAYATWLIQNLFQQFAPQWLDWYPLIALPVAFLVAAIMGMLLERTIIRHLYGRPLETLLATWGISLMLIQLIRMLFGAQNLEVSNPSWLSGGLQVLPNLVLPYNRIAVILFVFAVLGLTWLLLNKTRMGLSLRAVTQNRAMADCCGVPTGRVDMLAFGLGSGIAGLGGVALSQLSNVGPELGQGYIIDSFLVVVLGGVGQLAGTVVAAFSLGILNKVLEPQVGAVLGKILILVFIVLFIQKRPQGLFALKGRIID